MTNLLKLNIGAVLEIDNVPGNMEVASIWDYEDPDGWTWREYRLRTPGADKPTAYLYVENDDGDWIIQYYDQKVDRDNLDAREAPGTIVLNSVPFIRKETGTASAVLTHENGVNSPERYAYADYKTAGAIASIETWPDSDENEVWVGRNIKKRQVEVLSNGG